MKAFTVRLILLAVAFLVARPFFVPDWSMARSALGGVLAVGFLFGPTLAWAAYEVGYNVGQRELATPLGKLLRAGNIDLAVKFLNRVRPGSVAQERDGSDKDVP